MIYEVRHFWVADDRTPTREDIEDAVKKCKELDCVIVLNWKGPGYRWYGDKYSREITKYSDVEEVVESLPKIYGL